MTTPLAMVDRFFALTDVKGRDVSKLLPSTRGFAEAFGMK